jgi:hypothetical protein
MVVPAWLDTRRALAVDADGRWLWLEKNLTAAPCDRRMLGSS